MASFTWDFSSFLDYAEEIEERRGALEEAIGNTINELGAKLLEQVQVNLSGAILQQRTGQLLNAVEWQAAQWVGAICQTSVGIDDGSPSFLVGCVQEFGGTSSYDIYPVNAKALAFEGEGGMVFAKHVVHPPLPARRWLGTAADWIEEQVYTELDATVSGVLTGEMV